MNSLKSNQEKNAIFKMSKCDKYFSGVKSTTPNARQAQICQLAIGVQLLWTVRATWFDGTIVTCPHAKSKTLVGPYQLPH